MLVRLISRLPLPVLYGFGWCIFVLAYYVTRYRRDVVRKNLHNSFPDTSASELAQIEKNSYRRLGWLIAEVLKGITIPADALKRRVRVVNPELLYKYLDQGQNVLILTSHFCNWEWALLSCSLQLRYPFHALYKPLHVQYWERVMYRMRTRFGGTLLPAKSIMTDILRRRGEVRCIGMVADQVPTSAEKKIWIDFLNQDTAFYPGPGEIARVTGFPVFFMKLVRPKRGHYEISFVELASSKAGLPTEDITRKYAATMEQLVIDRPADWFWIHRRWKLKKPVYDE